MTTGLPARVAICAVLTAQLARPVRADVPPPVKPAAAPVSKLPTPQEAVTPERRQVAVIDLSEDEKVRKLSGDLYVAINASDTMMVPNKRGFDMYLTGSLSDEEQNNVESAKTTRASALAYLDDADSEAAEAAAKNGQGLLAQVTPSPEVQGLYAELSFLAGLAELDQGKAQDANLALALAHRLDPARQLSDARYPPNTILAYKRAIESKPQLVKIDVAVDPATKDPALQKDVRVWIDFVDRGPLGSFDGVEVGDHVISLVGPAIRTIGTAKRISGPTTVPFKPVAASPELEVKRARLALARAQLNHDDGARQAAMKQLAALLGVEDAVLISKAADGTLQWETWREHGAGFSAAHAYTDQKPDDILEGLGPLHRPKPPSFVPATPLDKLPITVDTPWYRERWIQASVGAGVVAVIVGSVLLATRTRQLDITTDVKNADPASSSR